MELYQLRYFEAVARAGSMIAAAAELHVTQPTLSAQIKALEGEFGLPLLERHHWGTRPTRAGERVLASARRIFEDLDQLRQDVRERKFGRLPALRLGIQPFLAAEVFAEPLRELKSKMPDLRVVIRERPNEMLMDSLLSGQVDLCLMSKPPSWPKGLICNEIKALKYAAYFRVDHPLAAQRNLSLIDLLPYPLLIFNGPTDPGGHLQKLADRKGVELHVAFSTDQATTAFAMAAKGAGVAILPAVFQDHCARSKLKQSLLKDFELEDTVCAVWQKKKDASAGAEQLLELIRKSTALSP